MGRISTRRRIARMNLAEGSTQPHVDTLLVEEPLEIRAIAQHHGELPPLTTMRTPGHDLDLATGLLLTEGIITHPQQIAQAMHCVGSTTVSSSNIDDGPNVLQVALTGTVRPPRSRTLDASSACGVCGTTSIDEVRERLGQHRVPVPPAPSQIPVAELVDGLTDTQRLFATTGGSHAAAIFEISSGTSHLVTREDVGRHNAVDKAIGSAAREQTLADAQLPWPPVQLRALVTSSRASFEIVQKAWVAGISVVVTVSASSSLAVEVAQAAGITLIGMVRRGRANVYVDSSRATTAGSSWG